ncbi:hypothetical protein P4G82_27810 [Bacillus cereus]|nr:hypothetical protein [Bacillus cereus]
MNNNPKRYTLKSSINTYKINVHKIRDGTTKSIKIESWRSLKDEMLVLGITDRDIFQIQMIKKDSSKK